MVTSGELIKLAECGSRNENYSGWNRAIVKFAKKYPEDTFFLKNDIEEPPFWDYCKDHKSNHLVPLSEEETHAYTEWEK